MMRWMDVSHSFKKALFISWTGKKGFQSNLCGHTFRVAYEARGWPEDRDYNLLHRLAKGRTCILDVGANIGMASLVISTSMQPDGAIHAFEASEDACRVASENFRLNNLEQKIQMVNALVSETSGDVCAFYWDHASGGASTIAGYLGRKYAVYKATLSIDTYCERINILPDLVKIDVEGAEAGVLLGMRRVLTVNKPVIALELHGWDQMSVAQNAANILPYLWEVGYQMIYLQTQKEIKDASVLSNRGRCHVLLLPQGDVLPEALADLDMSHL